MSLEEIIENLNDLVQMKNTKINGLICAVDILKDRQKKVLRELGYLRSQYDSKVERDVMEIVINLVKKIYE